VTWGNGMFVAVSSNGPNRVMTSADDGQTWTQPQQAPTPDLTAPDVDKKVKDISCGDYACVARFADGSANAWGHPNWGGSPNNNPARPVMDGDGPSQSVVDISCGGSACVARFADGSAKAWGDPDSGGDVTNQGGGDMTGGVCPSTQDDPNTTTELSPAEIAAIAAASTVAAAGAAWGGVLWYNGDKLIRGDVTSPFL